MNKTLVIQFMLACTLAAGSIAPAHAGCSTGFCTINSNWDIQGGPAEPGTRLGLRYEYINQDQLRAGTNEVDASEVDREEIEIGSKSKNLLATIDYSPGPTWGVSLLLPAYDRSHSHLMSDTGETEAWNYTELGDMRVLGRYRFAPGEAGIWGISAGIKLPTGSFDITNDEGDTADRMYQPGSGTTDALLGIFGNRLTVIADHPAAWFMEAQVQQALAERDNYKPGAQLLVDGGLTYAASGRTNLMLQANLLVKDRDSGAEAETEDTGGTFLFLAPGLAYALSREFTVYGFVQMPLYQRVNGIQLTADRSIAAGISYRL